MKDFITSGGVPLMNPLEMHKLLKQKKVEVATHKTDSNSVVNVDNGSDIGLDSPTQLDWSQWLPFAATKYNISPKVEDYVLVPVITIPADLPNRNGVGFPLKELVAYNPEHGRQAYKTFKGKPTHVEHKNDNIEEAKGVIVDTFLRQFKINPKVWKLLELLAFDRTKDPVLCKQILKGDMNSYSMGAWVDGYTCSYCGANMGDCSHLHPNEPLDFYRIGDRLVFRRVVNPVGFETSSVATPAYTAAISDKLYRMGDGQDLLRQRPSPSPSRRPFQSHSR